MKLLCRQKATLLRASNDFYYNEKGDWVHGSTTHSEIVCSIQPPFGSDGYTQYNLPDGVTLKDCKNIYTKTLLRTGSEYDKIEADTLVINGMSYEVFSVDEWFSGTGRLSHYKALVIRKDKICGNN